MSSRMRNGLDIYSRADPPEFIVFAVGELIAWQSKLQTTSSTYSMQRKYQAINAAMQEQVWLWGVLGELQIALCEPTLFFLDNQSAQDLAVNPVFHKSSKHIAIKFHWVHEHVDPDHGTATLIHVRTKDQIADIDIFTKSLTGQDFVVHRERSLGELRKDSEAVTADNRRHTGR